MEEPSEALGVHGHAVDHLIQHVVVYELSFGVGNGELATSIGHAKDKLFGLLVAPDIVVRDVRDVHFVQHAVVGLKNDLVPILQDPHLLHSIFNGFPGFLRLPHLHKCWQEREWVAQPVFGSEREVGKVAGRNGRDEAELPGVQSEPLGGCIRAFEDERHEAIASQVVKLHPLARHIPGQYLIVSFGSRVAHCDPGQHRH